MFGILTLAIASQLQIEPPSAIKDWWQGEHRSIPFRISLTDAKGKELNVSVGTLSIRKESFDISVRNVRGETFASYASGRLWFGTVGVEKFAVPGTMTRDDALNESLGIMLDPRFPQMIGLAPRGARNRIDDGKSGLRTIRYDRESKGGGCNYRYSDRTGEPTLITKNLEGPRMISPDKFDIFAWRCQFGRTGKPAYISDPTRSSIFSTWDESAVDLLDAFKPFRQVSGDWFTSRRTFFASAATYDIPQALIAIVSVLGDHVYWREGKLVDSHSIAK